MIFSKYKTVIFGLIFIQQLVCMELKRKTNDEKVFPIKRLCLEKIPPKEISVNTIKLVQEDIIPSISTTIGKLQEIKDKGYFVTANASNEAYFREYQLIVEGVNPWKTNVPWSCAFSPNGNLLALYIHDWYHKKDNSSHKLKIFDVLHDYATKLQHSLDSTEFNKINFINSKHIALWCDLAIEIFDIVTDKIIWRKKLPGKSKEFYTFAALKDKQIALHQDSQTTNKDNFFIDIWDYCKNVVVKTICITNIWSLPCERNFFEMCLVDYHRKKSLMAFKKKDNEQLCIVDLKNNKETIFENNVDLFVFDPSGNYGALIKQNPEKQEEYVLIIYNLITQMQQCLQTIPSSKLCLAYGDKIRIAARFLWQNPNKIIIAENIDNSEFLELPIDYKLLGLNSL